MTPLPRIASATPVISGVLRIAFVDGYEGVVDLRPLIAKGGVLDWLADPANFSAVSVSEYGHSVVWIDDRGYEIDFGAANLRRDCERQAAVHMLMAV